MFFVSLAAGVLIDIDHVFDYYLQEGVTLRLKDMYAWCDENKFKLIFLFFHSVELVALLWLVIMRFRLGLFWAAAAVGFTQHLLLDIIFNPIYSYSYFLSYRIARGFKKEHLMKKE